MTVSDAEVAGRILWSVDAVPAESWGYIVVLGFSRTTVLRADVIEPKGASVRISDPNYRCIVVFWTQPSPARVKLEIIYRGSPLTVVDAIVVKNPIREEDPDALQTLFSIPESMDAVVERRLATTTSMSKSSSHRRARLFFHELKEATDATRFCRDQQCPSPDLTARKQAIADLTCYLKERTIDFARAIAANGTNTWPTWTDQLNDKREIVSQEIGELLECTYGRIDNFRISECASDFFLFANGALAEPDQKNRGIGEPDSWAIFCFATFAIYAIETGDSRSELWRKVLPAWIKGAAIYESAARVGSGGKLRLYRRTKRTVQLSSIPDPCDGTDLAECKMALARVVLKAAILGLNSTICELEL